ncbi:MAG TPA: hypothetical protein VFZ56_05330 [Gemmatimonadaceae bacterium]
MPVLALSLLAAACRTTPAPAAPQSAAIDPAAFAAELDLIAATELWPGFDLRAVPVAVFDGSRTLLFRHPSPPEGFVADSASGVWIFPGRHPAVTANNSVELGGVMTAGALLSSPTQSLRDRAAVVAHEAFHVYQGQRHPRWVANEVELFAYPVDDGRLLALRRLETIALNRALTSSDPAASACWTGVALATRRERFAALPAGSAEYERKNELKEGLARYVQWRAGGGGWHVADDPPPDAVRDRAYASGASLALLLDRFSPAWKAALSAADSIPLDVLLADAPGLRAEAARCGFNSAERAQIASVASADVERLRARRAERRQALLEQSGWRVVIAAGESLLFPQEFDPLNVHMVAPGEVVHSRYVRLGNSAGTVEVFGRSSLTEAAGAHPLFNGVRALTVSGLATAPAITENDGTVSIRADGLTAEFRGAAAQMSGDTLTVRLAPRR